MWLVSKLHNGLEPSREVVPADLLAALTRWYEGRGDPRDERAAVRLVQRARAFERWLACGCRGEHARPPLLSAAYLSEAETYYLRRLVGQGRPEHDTACPYFREQKVRTAAQPAAGPRPVDEPDGFFHVLKPLPEHLAQRPDAVESSSGAGGSSTPRLARLLWRLIDAAELNRITPLVPGGQRSIQGECSRLQRTAQANHIAPGVRLDELLFTHPAAFHKKVVYARLRRREPDWPNGYAPQAFLALYATNVSGREIFCAGGDPVIVTGRVQVPPGGVREVGGPYLVLVAVGRHPEARGYAALRAYAQPIYDGRHFVPVDGAFERVTLAGLLRLQAALDRRGIELIINKPVFDLPTEHGPCRPSFLLSLVDRTTGALGSVVVQAPAYGDPPTADDLALNSLGPVLCLDTDKIDDGETWRSLHAICLTQL